LAEEQQLRGYDAVHLAAAQTIADANTVFASGDHDLIAAAAHLGLTVAPARWGERMNDPGTAYSSRGGPQYLQPTPCLCGHAPGECLLTPAAG